MICAYPVAVKLACALIKTDWCARESLVFLLGKGEFVFFSNQAVKTCFASFGNVFFFLTSDRQILDEGMNPKGQEQTCNVTHEEPKRPLFCTRDKQPHQRNYPLKGDIHNIPNLNYRSKMRQVVMRVVM